MHYNPLKEMRTKVTFLSLLCIVGTFLTTMHAQESCYEQYLQEHDMKILTAEDADDSYDELKKTILAKQMYGDSYVVIADSITQRVKLTKVDGTYIADMHVTLVDSTWYMWLSVDPLAGEYPQISPYSYCMWNPIQFVDPDGKEVINEIDKTKDPDLYAVANEHQTIDNDNSTITLYAHGSNNYIELKDGTTISTAKQFEEYLSNNSTLWNSTENKKNLSIVLMSCNTGNIQAEESPIAEKISKVLGNIVFAPTTEVTTKDKSFYGLYRMNKIDPNTHCGIVYPDQNHMGNWQAFTPQGSIELDYRASNIQFGFGLLKFLKIICGYEK